jgi:hypothetical protein
MAISISGEAAIPGICITSQALRRIICPIRSASAPLSSSEIPPPANHHFSGTH